MVVFAGWLLILSSLAIITGAAWDITNRRTPKMIGIIRIVTISVALVLHMAMFFSVISGTGPRGLALIGLFVFNALLLLVRTKPQART